MNKPVLSTQEKTAKDPKKAVICFIDPTSKNRKIEFLSEHGQDIFGAGAIHDSMRNISGRGAEETSCCHEKKSTAQHKKTTAQQEEPKGQRTARTQETVV